MDYLKSKFSSRPANKNYRDNYDKAFKKERPAYLCEHANEVHSPCLCDADCYCKSHTCKDK